MKKYILAGLAALVLVVLALMFNTSGTNTPTPSARTSQSMSDLKLR